MDFKAYTLKKATEWIVGYNLFERITDSVNEYLNDDNKTGEEKRQAVLTDLKEIGEDFSSFLINLGIEVAVVLAKRSLGIK